MSQISFSIKDDNKDLIKSLEKRTQLFEKVLLRLVDSRDKNPPKIRENKDSGYKSINKMIEAFSKTMKKTKEPRIIVQQNDNKSLVSSINKRISLLQELIKKSRKNKIVINNTSKVMPRNNKPSIVNKNVDILVKSFQQRGSSVAPSPS